MGKGHGCQPKNRRILPPKWMVKIRENPMNKWMIWGAHQKTLFLDLHPHEGTRVSIKHEQKSITG